MPKDEYPAGKYWTDSWNFVYGCTPIGKGCTHCWAKANHERWGGGQYPLEVFSRPFNEVCVFPGRLNIPLGWRKPRIVAVNFSGDTWHPIVPDHILDQMHAVMALCPQHTFIDLTKRWKRRLRYLQDVTTSFDIALRVQKLAPSLVPDGPHVSLDLNDLDIREPFPNIWLGVSVSTQAELDAAMPHLLATPAAVRVLSLEPMLEELDLWKLGDDYGFEQIRQGIGWVIVGCETGPKRRPCPIEHIESIVAQATAAGVPKFVKAVEINGRVSTNMAEWPESICFRELPG